MPDIFDEVVGGKTITSDVFDEILPSKQASSGGDIFDEILPTKSVQMVESPGAPSEFNPAAAGIPSPRVRSDVAAQMRANIGREERAADQVSLQTPISTYAPPAIQPPSKTLSDKERERARQDEWLRQYNDRLASEKAERENPAPSGRRILDPRLAAAMERPASEPGAVETYLSEHGRSVKEMIAGVPRGLYEGGSSLIETARASQPGAENPYAAAQEAAQRERDAYETGLLPPPPVTGAGQVVTGLVRGQVEAAPAMAVLGPVGMAGRVGTAVEAALARTMPATARIAGALAATGVGASEFGAAASVPQAIKEGSAAPIAEGAVHPLTAIGSVTRKLAHLDVGSITPDEVINLGFFVIGGISGARKYAREVAVARDSMRASLGEIYDANPGVVLAARAAAAVDTSRIAREFVAAIDDVIAAKTQAEPGVPPVPPKTFTPLVQTKYRGGGEEVRPVEPIVPPTEPGIVPTGTEYAGGEMPQPLEPITTAPIIAPPKPVSETAPYEQYGDAGVGGIPLEAPDLSGLPAAPAAPVVSPQEQVVDQRRQESAAIRDAELGRGDVPTPPATPTFGEQLDDAIAAGKQSSIQAQANAIASGDPIAIKLFENLKQTASRNPNGWQVQEVADIERAMRGEEPDAGGTPAPLPPPAPQGAPSATAPSVQEVAAKIPKGERKASTVKEAVAQVAPQAAPPQQAADQISEQTKAEQQAKRDAIASSEKSLRDRLMDAKSVLANEVAKRFGSGQLDFSNKRLVSDDGKLALQWTNEGPTTVGSVRLVTVAQASPPQSPVQPPQEPAPPALPKKAKKSNRDIFYEAKEKKDSARAALDKAFKDQGISERDFYRADYAVSRGVASEDQKRLASNQEIIDAHKNYTDALHAFDALRFGPDGVLGQFDKPQPAPQPTPKKAKKVVAPEPVAPKVEVAQMPTQESVQEPSAPKEELLIVVHPEKHNQALRDKFGDDVRLPIRPKIGSKTAYVRIPDTADSRAWVAATKGVTIAKDQSWGRAPQPLSPKAETQPKSETAPLQTGDKVLYKGKEAEVAYVPEDVTKSISIRQGGRVFNTDRKNVTKQAGEPTAPQPSPTTQTTTPKETPNASSRQVATKVHGDVRTRPVEGQEKVSTKEGGKEVLRDAGEGVAEVRQGESDVKRYRWRGKQTVTWYSPATGKPMKPNTVSKNIDVDATSPEDAVRLIKEKAQTSGMREQKHGVSWSGTVQEVGRKEGKAYSEVLRSFDINTPPTTQATPEPAPRQGDDVVAQEPAKESFVDMARRKAEEARNPFGPDVKPAGSGPNLTWMFWKATEYAKRAMDAGVKGVAGATRWAIDQHKQRQAQKLEVEMEQKEWDRFRSTVVRMLKGAVESDKSFSETKLYQQLETLVGEKIVAPAVKVARAEGVKDGVKAGRASEKVVSDKKAETAKSNYRQLLEIAHLKAKAKGATEQGIREEVVRLAKENLPLSIRGKLLNYVAKSTTMARLRNAIGYMRVKLAEYNARNAYDELVRDSKAKELGNGLTHGKEVRALVSQAKAIRDGLHKLQPKDRIDAAYQLEDLRDEMATLLHDAKRSNEIVVAEKVAEKEAYVGGVVKNLESQPELPTEGDISVERKRGIRGWASQGLMPPFQFYEQVGGQDAYDVVWDNGVRAEALESVLLRDWNDANHVAAKNAGYKNVLAADADISGLLGRMSQTTIKLDKPVGGKSVMPLGQALNIALFDPMTEAMIDAGNEVYWREAPSESFVLTPEDRASIKAKVESEYAKPLRYLRDKMAYSESEFFVKANEAFRRLTGRDLGVVEGGYLTRVSQRQPSKGATLWSTSALAHQENAGYTKHREGGRAIEIGDANDVVNRHATALIKLIAHGEATRTAEMVMNDPRVRRLVASRYGEEANGRIETDLANLGHGLDPELLFHNAMDRFASVVGRRFAGGKVALSPWSWAKNALGGTAKMMAMFDVSDWGAGYAALAKHVANPGKSMRELAAKVPAMWRRYAMAPHTLATTHVTGSEPYLFEGTAAELRQSLAAMAKSLKGMQLGDAAQNFGRAMDTIRLGNVFDAFSAAFAYGAAKSKVAKANPSLSGKDFDDAVAHEVDVAMRKTQNSASKLDLPPIQLTTRKKPIQNLWMLFQSDNIKTLSMLRSGKGKAMAFALLSLALVSAVDTGSEEFFRDKSRQDKKARGKSVGANAAWNMARNLIGTVPNMDRVVNLVESLAEGRSARDATNRLLDPGVIGEFKNLAQGLGEAGEALFSEKKPWKPGVRTKAEEVTEGLIKTIRASTNLIGLPIGPLTRIFERLMREPKRPSGSGDGVGDLRLDLDLGL